MNIPRDDLGIEDAAVFVVEAKGLFDVLEAMNAHTRADHEPLPRGMMTCGEACRMVSAVIRMGLLLYPHLLEDGVIEEALRAAAARSATGVPN